jgi:hypothetical protein
MIAPDQVLYALSEPIRYRIPTSFQYRQAAAAGGLMSYGANAVDLFRLAGEAIGRRASPAVISASALGLLHPSNPT